MRAGDASGTVPPGGGLAALLPHKLGYAHRLAELGKVPEALSYISVSASGVTGGARSVPPRRAAPRNRLGGSLAAVLALPVCPGAGGGAQKTVCSKGTAQKTVCFPCCTFLSLQVLEAVLKDPRGSPALAALPTGYCQLLAKEVDELRDRLATFAQVRAAWRGLRALRSVRRGQLKLRKEQHMEHLPATNVLNGCASLFSCVCLSRRTPSASRRASPPSPR